ncbi:MAG: hypothetical protein JNM13_05625 [Hyphomicrobiaceae bacterium]|nr:hypothetical protein [Hyphomicrobiaceae bacterium]
MFRHCLKASTALNLTRAMARRLAGDETGNIGMTFALLLVPVIGLGGGVGDMARMYKERTQVQKAADAAALAGVKQLDKPDAVVNATIRSVLDANLPAHLRGLPYTPTIKNSRSTIEIIFQGFTPTSFLTVAGVSKLNYGVTSEATIGTDEAEIAIAVDVTGSMKNHMPSLKTATKTLVNAVYGGRAMHDRIKTSLIPYVATVNIASAPDVMKYMDVTADSKFHGQNFENVWLGDNDKSCDPPPPPPPVATPKPPVTPPPVTPPPVTPPPPPPPTPKPSPDLGAVDLPDLRLPSIAAIGDAASGILDELVGIKAAAAGGSPYGSAYDALYRASPEAAGYGPAPVAGVLVDCNRRTPSKVNHFHLFHAMGQTWKGCVEMRPEPYDIDDTVPTSANANTRFVPYLWPDERSKQSWMGTLDTRNDYLKDFGKPSRVRSWGDYENQAYVWKYWNTGLDKSDKTAFVQQDANSACPEPIVPLTLSRTDVDTAVDGLRPTGYGGSGTNIVEGLAWAWRTLTPGEPYTAGAYDKKRRKIVVLMTDGMNEVVPQTPWYNDSDYTAIGYADKARLGTSNLATITTKLDAKLAKLCTTVKGKKDSAEEITVYTVTFDPWGGGLTPQIQALMKDCATSSDHAFRASSGADLIKAFETIGRQISALRLAK